MNARTREGAIRILEGALDLIEPRGAWCQGVLYRDRQGLTCLYPQAASFCLTGAQFASAHRLRAGRWARTAAFHAVEDLLADTPIPNWNDAKGRRKGEVQAVLRRAIRSLRESAS